MRIPNEDKFLFDLNGFIVLRGVLDESELKSLHDGIDAHISEAHARDSSSLKNTKAGTSLSAKNSRMDLGGVLGWDAPHGTVFRKLLAHPKLVPYLAEFCGQGYRCDHQPLVIIQEKNSEGFSLHGGPLSLGDGDPGGEFNPHLQYRCVNGKLWNTLINLSVCLCDTDPGDGGFCVVRGSHKLNFPVPMDFANGESRHFLEHVYQPALKQGDVVFFSEATVHGAMPWKSEKQRRLILYRFSPPMFGYGRAYLERWGKSVIEKCNDAEKAVLEPPYAVRLERPLLCVEDGAVAVLENRRDPEKVQHDMALFGTKYF